MLPYGGSLHGCHCEAYQGMWCDGDFRAFFLGVFFFIFFFSIVHFILLDLSSRVNSIFFKCFFQLLWPLEMEDNQLFS